MDDQRLLQQGPGCRLSGPLRGVAARLRVLGGEPQCGRWRGGGLVQTRPSGGINEGTGDAQAGVYRWSQRNGALGAGAAAESKGGEEDGGAGVDRAEGSAGDLFISFGGGVSAGAEVLDSELTAALQALAKRKQVSSPASLPKAAIEQAVSRLLQASVRRHAQKAQRRLKRTGSRASNRPKKALLEALRSKLLTRSGAGGATLAGGATGEPDGVGGWSESWRGSFGSDDSRRPSSPPLSGHPPPPPHRPSIYGDNVDYGDRAYSQGQPIRIHLVATANTKTGNTRTDAGREVAQDIMRAFIAQSGIDEMDLVNDGEVHTINMQGKRKKKALAFKIVARPTAKTVSTLLELTKKGYSREALELTVNGTKKHFWVVLGLPGASNGGSAAPVFRIKFRAKKTEVDFMQLMVDLRINWYLFRVGNPFSIDAFYPLSGPANDIAFCVFESKDYGSLAKLALGKDTGVLSVRLVTPMHLPMYAPPRLPAATAATAASSSKGHGTRGSSVRRRWRRRRFCSGPGTAPGSASSLASTTGGRKARSTSVSATASTGWSSSGSSRGRTAWGMSTPSSRKSLGLGDSLARLAWVSSPRSSATPARSSGTASSGRRSSRSWTWWWTSSARMRSWGAVHRLPSRSR